MYFLFQLLLRTSSLHKTSMTNNSENNGIKLNTYVTPLQLIYGVITCFTLKIKTLFFQKYIL